jgi:hypothetical protein
VRNIHKFLYARIKFRITTHISNLKFWRHQCRSNLSFSAYACITCRISTHNIQNFTVSPAHQLSIRCVTSRNFLRTRVWKFVRTYNIQNFTAWPAYQLSILCVTSRNFLRMPRMKKFVRTYNIQNFCHPESCHPESCHPENLSSIKSVIQKFVIQNFYHPETYHPESCHPENLSSRKSVIQCSA